MEERKLIKVDEEFFSVEAETPTDYVCFPLGGGFRHTIPKTAAEECSYSMNWAPAKVAINTEEWFECMMDYNYHWNGWRDPYFEKEELIRFIEAEGMTVGEIKDDVILFHYQEPGFEIIEGNRYEATKCEIDGKELWNVSGFCFVAKEMSEEVEKLVG